MISCAIVTGANITNLQNHKMILNCASPNSKNKKKNFHRRQIDRIFSIVLNCNFANNLIIYYCSTIHTQTNLFFRDSHIIILSEFNIPNTHTDAKIKCKLCFFSKKLLLKNIRKSKGNT